ncbi:nucleoside kinase [Clostridium sp. DL1XJH146]
MYKVRVNNSELIEINREKKIYDIVKEEIEKKNIPVTLVKLNGKLAEMTHDINEDCNIELIDIRDRIAMQAYVRTLQFILIKAANNIFNKAKVTIEHSLSKGLYCEISKESNLIKEEIVLIKEEMGKIIEKNININKVKVKKERAVEIFSSYAMDDKLSLLRHVDSNEVNLYELEGRYDYFYGPMAPSTGIIKCFDLKFYASGFILRYPTSDEPEKLPEFEEHKKLASIFRETERWGNILNLSYVGALNDRIESNDNMKMILTAEALHEKKIANIADMISDKEKIKIVLIAGPSSSGKTTFTKRLAIQLMVNGLVPIQISLDDYFVEREKTPKDEDGNYDFESIYALDIELFNKQLTQLMNGENVILPKFNFLNGSREWQEDYIFLPENGVILIEGIHGLNEMLTSSIDKENKFKIYISALTQLNLDNHNRIATTDVRRIRRIVRDYLSRGYSAEDTLKMWPSIKKGEEKNIFPYQEEADVMFNSTLVYELCVLKKYAEPELEKIDKDSAVYYEAKRLVSFLHFFKDIDADLVPRNSILKEFFGGSVFYEY